MDTVLPTPGSVPASEEALLRVRDLTSMSSLFQNRFHKATKFIRALHPAVYFSVAYFCVAYFCVAYSTPPPPSPSLHVPVVITAILVLSALQTVPRLPCPHFTSLILNRR